MSEIKPLIEVDNDILIHSTYIHVVPVFVAIIIASIILAVFLRKAGILRKRNIGILIADFIAAAVGCTGYDTFLIKIYRGGYEVNFNTVSGVCMMISVFAFFLLAYQLYLLSDMQKQKEMQEDEFNKYVSQLH
jgi:hypothetical protein